MGDGFYIAPSALRGLDLYDPSWYGVRRTERDDDQASYLVLSNQICGAYLG